MHFKLLKAKNGQFYFTLNGKNGQVIMTSETYIRKASCKKTIDKICDALYWAERDGGEIVKDLTKPKTKKTKTNLIY